jgi:hypothetical protein
MAYTKPLMLLFTEDAGSIVQQLRTVVANENLVSAYHDEVHARAESLLLYDGISYTIDIRAPHSELGRFKNIFGNCNVSAITTVLAIDFGQNVAGGHSVAPVVLRLLKLGALLAKKLHAHSVAWTPGQVMSDAAYFSAAVSDYAAGGVFPALATVDFIFSDSGTLLNTKGLSWFSGQELEMRCRLLDQAEIMRRAVRIVHDVAINGAVTDAIDLPDLERDNILTLRPTIGGKLLKAEIRSIAG